MYCNKCGNEVPDYARFCEKCGNPVKQIENTEPNTKSQTDPIMGSFVDPGKSSKKTIYIIIAVALVVIIGIIAGFFILRMKNKPDGANEKEAKVTESSENDTENDEPVEEKKSIEKQGAVINYSEIIDAYQKYIDENWKIITPYSEDGDYSFSENGHIVEFIYGGCALLYLDDDDIPECYYAVISDNGSDSSSNTLYFTILTYNDGNIKAVSFEHNAGSLHTVYCSLKSGYIMTVDGGNFYPSYYKLQTDGSIKLVAALQHICAPEKYYINDKEVTEKEYNDYQNKFPKFEEDFPSRSYTVEHAYKVLEGSASPDYVSSDSSNGSTSLYEDEDYEAGFDSTTPFYGIWCFGSKSRSEAEKYADDLSDDGFDAQVIVTTDWSNLNSETWYVVTAGIYYSKDEAKSVLSEVKEKCSSAYMKYSGDYIGNN